MLDETAGVERPTVRGVVIVALNSAAPWPYTCPHTKTKTPAIRSNNKDHQKHKAIKIWWYHQNLFYLHPSRTFSTIIKIAHFCVSAKGNRTTLLLHEFCLAAGFLASSRQMPLRLPPFTLTVHYTHHMHTLTFVRSTAVHHFFSFFIFFTLVESSE